MQTSYQKQWAETFAFSHLNLAQASSNAQMQCSEINRAITILQSQNFPQTGNFNIINHFDPNSNIATSWQALYGLQNYANSTTLLNQNDTSYNIAIYNTQEKVQYFENNYQAAYDNYILWGAGQWLGYIVGIGSSIISVVLACVSLFTDDDMSTFAKLNALALLILIVAFATFFTVVSFSPVYYTGLT